MRRYASLPRQEVRARFAAFCAARPVGGKFAHRLTDRPAGSSPSMKWVNPPVAYMAHAGVPLLLDAGVYLPGLHQGDLANRTADGAARRVAVEAYPGLLAREILGRQSYKSDDRSRQDLSRLDARNRLLCGLEQGVRDWRCGWKCMARPATSCCKTPAATVLTPHCACCRQRGPSAAAGHGMGCRRSVTRWKAGL